MKMPKRNADQDWRLREYADLIEKFFYAYGIQLQVVEVNPEFEGIQYCMKVAIGTPLSSIMKHQKELVRVLAAPRGKLTIEAPIPGRDLVGITIPYVFPYLDLPEPPQPEQKGRRKGQMYMEIAAYLFRLSEKVGGNVLCRIGG